MVCTTQRPSDRALWLADDAEATIVEEKTGEVVFQVAAMASVWVELSASGSAAHGPALHICLVSDQYPQLAERKQAEGPRFKPIVASAKGKQKHSTGKVGNHGTRIEMQSKACHAAPAGALVQAMSDVDSEALHNHTDTGASPQESRNGERKPAASKIQHKKHANDDLSTIAAVLASSFVSEEDRVPQEIMSLDHNQTIASIDVQQDLVHAHASGHQPLVSCKALPSVTDIHVFDAGSCACAVWQAQLRLGKINARVNASLSTSEHMNRVQSKMQAVTLLTAGAS